MWVNIMGSSRFQIPEDFPLKVVGKNAIDAVLDYAENSLKIKGIKSSTVMFVTIQDHLYYLVSLKDTCGEYYVVVNPSTGEVGMLTNG
jgi:hypothetical protein